MSTTTTAPAVIDALVDGITNLDAGPTTHESWPGPDASQEMLVLGETEWDEYVIPTIKAARKQRQENYSIGFELFVFGAANTTPAAPREARLRAYELLATVENFLADDVTAGTSFAVVQHIQLGIETAAPRSLDGGWAYRIAGRFHIAARLT